MDKFRADVKKAMNGESVKIKEPQVYRVRVSWEDTNSQVGAYSDLNNAKKAADEHPGYSVFNKKGKAVYTSKKESFISETNQKILDSLPDYSGLPKSADDYLNKVSEIAVKLYEHTKILPSVVIGQCCLENGFGVGQDATELTKRNNLIG
jgi:flagellum-specific peptidoglycan hydrolase FlgJ